MAGRWQQFWGVLPAIAALLCTVAIARANDAAQKEAVELITKLGGTVRHDQSRPGTPVVEVQLTSPQLTDAEMPHFRSLPQLQRLTLNNARITSKGVESLSGLADLRYLFLGKSKVDGAAFTHLKDLPKLGNLEGMGPISDADLEQIKGMSQLTKLSVGGAEITGRGLESIKNLSNLSNLHVNQSQITDADLEKLKGLTQLRMLNISQNNVTGEGLKHLQHIPLQGLAMYVTQLDDAHMQYVKPLASLNFLDVRGSKVTDQGLAQITGLKKLGYLRLNNLPGITDAAFVHLKQLPQLEIVSLSNTGLTDAAIADLIALPKLKQVELRRTRITAAGFRMLQQARPNLKIDMDDAGAAPKGK